ncbi:outer membrane beta-barrel family protein [Mucilaginibacter sp.]|jgi:outer membrane receptor protein involved in Fe transport|uniref:outer membrane beta-barrel family protein n=1 Tax=Mucilaginibacter sp. TaxID=1882438 RepID=UPI002C805800|nr:outer membrane beta-barrel family protein [Mucilaginibacter sp.]HTI58192.1 outer membrane beta-barrel family protein [Mucilaginibacter sp.]
MKLIAGYLFAVLLTVAYNSSLAQSVLSAVHGNIRTEEATPADGATIVLLKARDSSVVKSTISGSEGNFSFTELQPGAYLLFITKLNYAKLYTGPYQLAAGKDLDGGVVTLTMNVRELNQVNITGKKDFLEVRPDRTVLNVDRNIVASGSTVYDLLRTAPGVKIVNDEVLKGGQKALITINGKPVSLSGEELINMLRNYQSSTVSQVELIDNSSAKYDAAGGGGMINIILKKNKNIGSNVGLTASGAVGDKYRSNAGINWDLKTDKLNLFASYNFTDNKTVHNFTNDRVIDVNNIVNNFDVDYTATTLSKNHSFNLGTDYALAPKHTIGVLFYGTDNFIDIDKRNNTVIKTDGQTDSGIFTQSNISRHITNLNYNANYRGTFGNEGKTILSADFNYSTYNRHSIEMLQNDFLDAQGQPDGTPLFYTDNSPSQIHVRSENIDLSHAISKNSSVDIGIKNSQVKSDNTIDFEQQINNASIPVADLTDHFIYNERIDAAYIRYGLKFTNGSLSLGLRAEQTNSTSLSVSPNRLVDSSYFNLFPNVQFTFEPDKDNQLTAFYSRNINRPNYQDLNPFVGYVDQFFYNTGNPFLKPFYINTIQVSDLYRHKYKITLNASVTNNYFSTIFSQDDVTKVYTTIKENIATRYRYSIQLGIPFEFTRWWNLNLDLVGLHDQFDYFAANQPKRGSFALEATLSQDFTITKKLSAQLESVYQSPTYFVINNYREDYFVNVGLRYAIAKNASLSLTASDIFNTDVDKIHSDYRNLNITQRDKRPTRFIGFTFYYHFGTSSSKNRNNTTDEQKRLGGSSNEN